jgi:hypothetical protein
MSGVPIFGVLTRTEQSDEGDFATRFEHLSHQLDGGGLWRDVDGNDGTGWGRLVVGWQRVDPSDFGAWIGKEMV